MTSFVKSYGLSEKYILRNNKNNKNKIKENFNKIDWTGTYDGKNAYLNMNLNDNGRTEHLNMVLNNNDLIEILNRQEVDIPIHERLQNDFLLKDSISPPSTNHLKKTRKYRHKHKHKENKEYKENKKSFNKSRKMQQFLSSKTL